MRISKESIFTGLNNLKVLSITDERFDEYFGFTDEDVKEMLRYYGREDHYEEMRNWYDGYRFGSTDVYCPWDVLNHCDKIKENAAAFPENYWVHTSSNEAVKKIIQMSGNVSVCGKYRESFVYDRIFNTKAATGCQSLQTCNSESGSPGYF